MQVKNQSNDLALLLELWSDLLMRSVHDYGSLELWSDLLPAFSVILLTVVVDLQ